MSTPQRPRRAEVLRAVIAACDARRDAVLPTDVPGVAETFSDDLDLLGALQLRWHTRLAGRIEREQADQPEDLAGSVVRAWLAVADETPGVRVVLDMARLRPADERTRSAMTRATAKEHLLLAASAGRAAPSDLVRGARVGAALELRARSAWAGPYDAPGRRGDAGGSVPARLWGRLRGLIPA